MSFRWSIALYCVSVCACSFVLAGAAAAQNLNTELLGQYPGDIDAILLDGKNMYVGQGHFFLVLDISNPAAIKPVSSCPFPGGGTVRSMAIVGKTVYAASAQDISGMSGGFCMFNVTNPALPTVLGSYTLSQDIRGIGVYGAIVCLAGVGGIQFVDMTVPSAPVLRGQFNSACEIRGMNLVGGMAYVSTNAGVQVVYAAAYWAPSVYTYLPVSTASNAVAVASPLAVVAGDYAGLQVLDVTYPTAAVLKSSTEQGTYIYDVVLAGKLAYAATANGLKVIDCTDPAMPRLRAVYRTPSTATHVAVSGKTAYVTCAGAGLHVISVKGI